MPVPRYTSYPAVPNWQETPPPTTWFDALQRRARRPMSSSLAVYVHLPFCETLCTFCGCNTVITRNHERSAPYVETVLAELDRLPAQRARRSATRPVSQIHLGGGTPTFMPPEVLSSLLKRSRRAAAAARRRLRGVGRSRSARDHARASRGAARARPLAHLARRAGHRHEVLRLVNRPQPFEITAALCADAREAGYDSINFDLIYGLPGQTPTTMTRLADGVVELRPDRLAVYSFARVPWIKPAQRKFKDEDVPVGAAKRELYEMLRDRLLAAGYLEIGLDHFALPHDALAVAFARRHAASQLHGLHRSPHHGAARPRRQRHLRNAGLLSPEREGDHRLRAPRRRGRDADAARSRAVGRRSPARRRDSRR